MSRRKIRKRVETFAELCERVKAIADEGVDIENRLRWTSVCNGMPLRLIRSLYERYRVQGDFEYRPPTIKQYSGSDFFKQPPRMMTFQEAIDHLRECEEGGAA